jgi:acyl-CoA synthetase (AMP-forming)/AMP-acid ligase II
LARQGVEPGDIVILIGTHDIDLYPAWLGCVWIGAVPTILAEPSVRVDREVYSERMRELVLRIGAKAVLVSGIVDASVSFIGKTPRFLYSEVSNAVDPAPAPFEPSPDDLLLLQHSSGTTGLHKGVMLTHEAVARHAIAYHDRIGLNANDVVASWLPLYHDMGLIACFLGPLLAGVPVVWLSPFEWVLSPSSLLHAAGKYGATLMWLPNFAFHVLAQRTREVQGTFALDTLRGVINCSEPVEGDAMDAFAARFRDDGLRPEALQTCYAMAENVFAVTSTGTGEGPRSLVADRGVWQREHRIVEAKSGVRLTSSGRPVSDCVVRVVSDDGEPAPPLTAGRLVIRSPFLLAGYFRRDDLNRSLFSPEGTFDTGDVGFLDHQGHLYVTGRRKDVVIVGGKNVYPRDVEEVGERVPGIRPGRVVCFGTSVPSLGTEALVVLAESDEPPDRWLDISRRLKVKVASELDLDVADARIVPRKHLRKSTSGKLARDGNREWYLAGRFGSPHPQFREPVREVEEC